MKSKIAVIATLVLVALVGTLYLGTFDRSKNSDPLSMSQIRSNPTVGIPIDKTKLPMPDPISEPGSQPPSIAELYQQLGIMDQYMKQNDVFFKLRQNNLDDTLREEFFRAITLRQNILEKIADLQIAQYETLFAGVRK